MRGSCLCGDTVWEVSGAGEMAHHCHCSMCRKAHGTAFATAAGFDAGSFRYESGGDAVRWFESSRGTRRGFCGRCGSSVPGDPVDGRVYVPLGALEGDPGCPPLAHIFVASKAPWHEIHDALPRFDAYPQGFSDPDLLPRDRPRARPGRVGGSCLCGGVAFELAGPVIRFYHCHCSRCRRARGAAHASNLFVAAADFEWTRGEESIRDFKLPEAERFGQAFCRTCGAKLPRVNLQRGYAVVPAGSLDDDPGARPQAHIFVGSKAPWYEIPEGLPRYEEAAP